MDQTVNKTCIKVDDVRNTYRGVIGKTHIDVGPIVFSQPNSYRTPVSYDIYFASSVTCFALVVCCHGIQIFVTLII